MKKCKNGLATCIDDFKSFSKMILHNHGHRP